MIDTTHLRLLHSNVQNMTAGAVADRAARGSIEALELRLDRQSMVIQTLLMLLLEKKVVTEDEYREWLKYVDGLDGKVDGRLKPDNSPIMCPSCGRNNASTAVRCQYCGGDFAPTFIDPRAKLDKD